MNHFDIREFRKEDESFVYNSWLKSAKDDHPEMTNSKFFAAYKDHVTRLMSTNDILVACDPDDSNHIYGYMVFKKIDDVLVIHWAYVKAPFRKFKVFSLLITEVFPEIYKKPIIITYKNDKRAKMFESLKMVFKPEYRSLEV